jgi:hypothetical protein
MTADNRIPIKQLPVRMPEDVYNTLKGAAFYTNRSMNEIVVAALIEHLETLRRDGLEAIVKRAQDEYRVVLDRLAEL